MRQRCFAVNGSALPQKTKNALIDAALDPQKICSNAAGSAFALLRTNLSVSANSWQPLICDFAEFFPIDGNEKALLLSEMKYDASPVDECLICPPLSGLQCIHRHGCTGGGQLAADCDYRHAFSAYLFRRN